MRVIVGGPWPERIGCRGALITPTPQQARAYPFAGASKNEVIVKLDDDPLARRPPGPFDADPDDFWTCCIAFSDVEPEPR